MTNVTTKKAGREEVMINQSRETKVLVVLGISITLGAIILNALGHNPPSAGAFCLSRYNRLGSVNKSILSRAAQIPGRWSRIEIYYKNTETDNISQLATLSDGGGLENVNCHFIICNGCIGYDGQIQPTEKWQRQLSVVSGQNQDGDSVGRTASSGSLTFYTPANRYGRLTDDSDKTIRICVITDDDTASATDFQIKRTEALVEKLCRKFDIQFESVQYPDNWH